MKHELYIPTPSPAEVKKYLKLWISREENYLPENSLSKLFSKTYPLNKNFNEVLIKVCALNQLYSTRIYDVLKMAKHIVNLDIDKGLKGNNIELVNEISINHRIRTRHGRGMRFYSFATKYCSFHKPATYPIYDSHVEGALIYFRSKDNFYDFSREDLRLYAEFKKTLLKLSEHYSLQQFNLRQLDRYLWQVGKQLQ